MSNNNILFNNKYKRIPEHGWKKDTTSFGSYAGDSITIENLPHVETIQLYHYAHSDRICLFMGNLDNLDFLTKLENITLGIRWGSNKTLTIDDIDQNIPFLDALTKNDILTFTVYRDLVDSLKNRPGLSKTLEM